MRHLFVDRLSKYYPRKRIFELFSYNFDWQFFCAARPEVKRAESMKIDSKKPKRTPSFTTRRRTQSFRKHQQRMENVNALPPVEIQGLLERKHELQSGGKKAAVRSWKQYYTGKT